MALHRAIFAVLLSLIMAFAPIASAAMARSCAMSSEASADSPSHCPCHGSMPQYQNAASCACQCFMDCGIVADLREPLRPEHAVLAMNGSPHLTSLAIQPPAPPPRA